MKINVSLGALPCYRFEDAIGMALGGLSEPALGALSADDLQLCPQNMGYLSEELATEIARKYPSQFRLHANVRVLPKMTFSDASTFKDHPDWFIQAGKVSRLLQAPSYTVHAGERANCDLQTMFNHVRAIEDIFGCAVGVEGLYPTKTNKYLLSDWDEYATLLDSGVKYALDLSHLNILAHHSGKQETGLVSELLQSENCIEIHLSGNDGMGDSHSVLDSSVWWFNLLGKANPKATLFSEGNQRPDVRIRRQQ